MQVHGPRYKRSLINFLVPIEMHQAFDAICELEGRSRTSVLLSLMSGFIATEGQRIIDDTNLRNRLKEIRSAEYPDTGGRPEPTSREKSVQRKERRWGADNLPSLFIDDHRYIEFEE